MLAEPMQGNRTLVFKVGYGIFTQKFNGTHTPFTQGDIPRIPGKYSAVEQEWCHHRQEKMDTPVILLFLHEP